MTTLKNAPIIENKKARYEYYVEETYECGIELRGNEVKSIRQGKVSLKESWVTVENAEMSIRGMSITAWSKSNLFDIDEKRDKKLLLHKREIVQLESKVKISGYTLIVLKLYFNPRGRCKALVGLCKGKHTYDKRRCEKDKAVRREIETRLKSSLMGGD